MEYGFCELKLAATEDISGLLITSLMHRDVRFNLSPPICTDLSPNLDPTKGLTRGMRIVLGNYLVKLQ